MHRDQRRPSSFQFTSRPTQWVNAGPGFQVYGKHLRALSSAWRSSGPVQPPTYLFKAKEAAVTARVPRVCEAFQAKGGSTSNET